MLALPTARAVALAAGAAPLALLLAALAPQAWIAAPIALLGLLLAILLDALLAGPLDDARLMLPAELEVGASGTVLVLADFPGSARQVRAAIALDPRLAPGGRLLLDLVRDGAGTHWQGQAALTPSRRGTGEVAQLWLGWSGPLGLGARQHRRAVAQSVGVAPNLALLRGSPFQTILRDAQFGMIERRFRGEGTQFEALAEYRAGMDRRAIDWKSSARHARLYAKEFEAERNNHIVFAIDCGAAMSAPVAGLARIDHAVSAALACSWVALKGGDKAALFGFAARPLLATPFIGDTHGFHRLRSAAAALDYTTEEPNFTLGLATLASRLQRRCLIVVFSDFADPTGAELMIESIGRLIAHHRVIFVTLADAELEGIAGAAPESLDALAMAVSAEALLQQRRLVLARLRGLGVECLEAPHERIGTRLIDAYLTLRQREAIG